MTASPQRCLAVGLECRFPSQNPPGAMLDEVARLTGKSFLRQLDGRASSHESFSVFPRYGNQTRKRVSWIVRGAPNAVVSLTAGSTKAGVARAEVTLPE